MPTDLTPALEARLARLQGYADALDYPFSVDVLLRPLLKAGRTIAFERAEAWAYRNLIYAVLTGQPDCVPEARAAHEQFMERVADGRFDLDVLRDATRILQGRHTS
jgi:hypothetical protein